MITAASQIHSYVLDRFAKLLRQDRLAHAYLFVGPKEVGKGSTALAVAKLLNCQDKSLRLEGQFCDQCEACIKINSGNHPDIYVVDSSQEDVIKIEHIRELLDRMKLRALLAEKKVFIIKNIENLTTEAANAFLKSLEEPSSSTVIILTTSALEKNLDTVRSRCHLIHFFPMAYSRLEGILRDKDNTPAPTAHFLARFSEGCQGKAEALNDPDWLKRKNDFIDQFILSASGGETFIKEATKDKAETKECLEIMMTWLRDAILIKNGAGENEIISIDRMKDLQSFQKRFTFEELLNLYEQVVKVCQYLEEKLNVKIPLLIIKEQLNYV